MEQPGGICLVAAQPREGAFSWYQPKWLSEPLHRRRRVPCAYHFASDWQLAALWPFAAFIRLPQI